MLLLSYTILILPDLSADVCFSDHLKVQCLSTSHFSFPEPLGQFACGIYEISIELALIKQYTLLNFVACSVIITMLSILSHKAVSESTSSCQHVPLNITSGLI